MGRRDVTRIGVIADNHSRATDGSDVPQAVLDAFAGVDLIVHCGDAGSWGTLDRLATVAPVVAVKGGHNGSSEDDRVQGQKRVVDIGGLRAGIVHDLVSQGVTTESNPRLVPKSDLRESLTSFFGEPIDVLLYAGTHVPRIAYAKGMLMVNPGSPTLPADRPRPSLGSVAVVDIDGEVATAKIVELWR
ncbi:MAG: metallophosphoesterase family protein [Chloroflexi bacterium]|nr:MAG: metallophosphoesterase family protein [Chloroflexota bacterium]TMB98140.1 MAG: metallophosphoesterase family protein [Chloroflexota bacterium]TMC27697.1 MAG: metallophosphoesterase family protein [Chloroflexota bacterium]TMC37475.1 MAG: metallophosphoesterase family protein [Chloroflexota bacterium]TME42560.1 MAG: metallophosphoesterase family protein [Chloroflexota bacterium]